MIKQNHLRKSGVDSIEYLVALLLKACLKTMLTHSRINIYSIFFSKTLQSCEVRILKKHYITLSLKNEITKNLMFQFYLRKHSPIIRIY